jgi:fermentation-respiration switch protein FrsA (DUF1100 family)
VPTLIIHGDDDQIVPIGASAMLSSKLIEHARLAIYRGAPHGLCSTLKEKVTGTKQRRSVALILHESSQPSGSPATDWTPKGLCKN